MKSTFLHSSVNIFIIITISIIIIILPKFFSNNKLEINFRKTTIDLSL